MKNFIVLLSVAAFLLAPLGASAQNTFTLDQVFQKIDEASKTFSSIEATMDRNKVTIAGGIVVDDHDMSSGKFYYVKSGKDPRVKLEITKPQQQFVLVDKGKAQIYAPKINQVQEFSTAGHEDTVEMFLALGFGQTSQDLKKHFDVTLAPDEVVDGQKRTVLDLKPKNSGTYKSVRMWLDHKNWGAVKIKTVEKTDSYLEVKFSNPRFNGNIPDTRFRLNMPKDVKVIKMG